MTVPEFTLVRGLALVLALLGLQFVTHGLRCSYWDEPVIGGLFLCGAWWLV